MKKKMKKYRKWKMEIWIPNKAMHRTLIARSIEWLENPNAKMKKLVQTEMKIKKSEKLKSQLSSKVQRGSLVTFICMWPPFSQSRSVWKLEKKYTHESPNTSKCVFTCKAKNSKWNDLAASGDAHRANIQNLYLLWTFKIQ